MYECRASFRRKSGVMLTYTSMDWSSVQFPRYGMSRNICDSYIQTNSGLMQGQQLSGTETYVYPSVTVTNFIGFIDIVFSVL